MFVDGISDLAIAVPVYLLTLFDTYHLLTIVVYPVVRYGIHLHCYLSLLLLLWYLFIHLPHCDIIIICITIIVMIFD